MARRKKGGGGAGGALLIVAVVLFTIISSIPKEVWTFLGVVVVIGLICWGIAKYKASNSATVKAATNGNWEDEARVVRQKREAEKRALVRPPAPGPLPPGSTQVPLTRIASAQTQTPHYQAATRSDNSLGRSSQAEKPAPPIPGRWVPPDDVVPIAGVAIRGGLFYTGTYLGQPLDSPDPCLINPVLSVAAQPSYTDLGYWPSYTTITPAARRGYLSWLANGREDPLALTGYVFLFFYGLERRLILDSAEISKSERSAIAEELRRLLGIYGANSHSFRTYGTSLLEFVTLVGASKGIYNEPLPELSRSYELPLYLCLALGQTAVDDVPVPETLALSWVKLEPSIYLKTPAVRCPEQFEVAFKQRYRAAFGEGIKLPRNRSRLRLEYKPASAAFGGKPVKLDFADTPDVRALTAPLKKLVAVVDQAQEDIDAYSRFIGKNPTAAGTLEAALLLPANSWPTALQGAFNRFVESVHEGHVQITFQEFQAHFSVKTGLTRERAMLLMSTLESAGVVAEPDLLYGARLPKVDDPMVFFAANGPEASSADAHYKTAALTLQLAAAVASADGDFSAHELLLLQGHVRSWAHLSPGHNARLLAHLELLIKAPISLASLKKKIEPLPQQAKESLASFLTTVAAADGSVSPKEVKLLESAYKALDIDPTRVYSDLHHAAAVAKPSTAGGAPVPSAQPSGLVAMVESSDEPIEVAIPRIVQVPSRIPRQVSGPTAPSSGFVLDVERLAAARAESERVAALMRNLGDPEAMVVVPTTVLPIAEVASAAVPVVAPKPVGLEAPLFQLDQAKIAELKKETEKVTALLAGIFADETPDDVSMAHVEVASEDEPAVISRGLLGLDAAHAAFARVLMSRPVWSREELADVAADLELMLDGALEKVNDATFDEHDIPFCEGDDPVEINAELLEKLEA